MNPIQPSQSRRIALIALSIPVLCSVLLLAAAWSVRSEARDRDRAARSRERPTVSYGFDTGRSGFGYALLTPGSSTIVSHDRVWRDLRERLDDPGDEVLWFSIRGRDYLVRERATIERARDIVGAMEALGEKQGRLGVEQGRLGSRQAAIGARQAAIGARQAALSTHLARLSLEDADEEGRQRIEDQLQELSRRMEALARDHEPLARRQEELGRRQSELGREMEQLSKRVSADLEHLAEEAIDRGDAERLD